MKKRPRDKGPFFRLGLLEQRHGWATLVWILSQLSMLFCITCAGEEPIIGTYKSLSHLFFIEVLILKQNGECEYYSESDVVDIDAPPHMWEFGWYEVKDNTLMFGVGKRFLDTREVRHINGVTTIWRHDAVEMWREKKTYRTYGIMIPVTPINREEHVYELADITRILNNDVHGVTIAANKGQILKLIPKDYRAMFAGREQGSHYFRYSETDLGWLGKPRAYEYNSRKDRSHARHGIAVVYFADEPTKLESVKTMKNGTSHGKSILFYRNGHERFIHNYENSEKHGISRHYNDRGVLTAAAEFRNGRPISGTVREIDWENRSSSEYILCTYADGKLVDWKPSDEQGNTTTNEPEEDR